MGALANGVVRTSCCWSDAMFKSLQGLRRGMKKKEDQSIGHFLLDAIYAFETGHYIEAAERFKLIVHAFPDHPLAHLMLGRAYVELRQYKLAIDSLFNHLGLVPNSVEALIYLGMAYYECGRMDLAEARFEQAMELRKEGLLARENLAITRIKSGDLEEALDDLVILHKEQPNDSGVVELVVLTLGRLGRWEAAKQYIHEMKKAQVATES